MCHFCRIMAYLPKPTTSAVLWTYSNVEARLVSDRAISESLLFFRPTTRVESSVMKFLIVAAATLGMVVAASAADLPHRQPVYQTAAVGKWPIGKTPIGKTPIGKTPVAARY